MLPFLAHLVIPAFLAFLAAIGLVASARLRARRHHATVRSELEARAGTATDGVVLLRGKLVVEGEGCASERGDGKAPVAARTHWGSVERFWLSESVPSTNERAPMLWLETAKGAVRIEGPVAVELGSSLRCSGHRAFVDREKRFDVATTVVDGDEVLLLGRRKEEAQDRSTGCSYRKSASRGVVEPTPETGYARLVSVRAPKAALAWTSLARHPLVLVAALLGAVLGWVSGEELTYDLERRRGTCREYGLCHVDTAVRWQGWKALGWLFDFEHSHDTKLFTLRAHDAAECLRSRACMQSGRCSLSNGECEAARDEDCKLTHGCLTNGECSAYLGGCAIAKDADCQSRSECRELGQCSVVAGTCAVVTDEDCRRGRDCETEGHCTAREGRCIASGDADCAASVTCLLSHACSAVNETCARSNRDCRSLPECTMEGLCSSDGDFCRAGTDEDCRASFECANFGRCRTDGNRCVGDGKSCASSAACAVHGSCGGVSGDATGCGVRFDRDCMQSTRCKTEGACKLINGECAASCATTIGCRELGRCTESQGHCVVGAEADCQASSGCVLDGRCSRVGRDCRATDADCAKTAACRFSGWCSANAEGSGCWATHSSDCRPSRRCKEWGACTAGLHGCWLESDDDCAATAGCLSDGKCTYVAASGQCEVGNAGCRQTPRCKELGYCTATTLDGETVCRPVTDDDCRQSEVCRLRGFCQASAGHCFDGPDD